MPAPRGPRDGRSPPPLVLTDKQYCKIREISMPRTLPDFVPPHLAEYSRTRTRLYGESPRAKTIDERRLALERFAHNFRAVPPAALTLTEIKGYILDVAAHTGQSNVNQLLTAVTGFLSYLADSRIYPRAELDEFLRWKKSQYLPNRSTATPFKYLRPEELSRLMSTIASQPNELQASRDVSIFGLLFLFVSRIGEMAAVNCDQIQYRPSAEISSRFIFTTEASQNKTHKAFLREISDDASVCGGVDVYRHLNNYFAWRVQQSDCTASRPPSVALPFFVALKRNHLGRPCEASWHSVFSTHARRAGMEHVTTHWLRHTAGEIAKHYLAGHDIRRIYGHSSERTTELYTDHSNPEQDLAARHTLAQAMSQY